MSLLSLTMAADVSSQLVSMPRIFMNKAIYESLWTIKKKLEL